MNASYIEVDEVLVAAGVDLSRMPRIVSAAPTAIVRWSFSSATCIVLSP